MNAAMREEDCGSSMPFQEKRAWLSLAVTIVIYGAFLANVLATPVGALTMVRFIILFTVAMTLQGVILAICISIFAARDPEAAKAPLDERDLQVSRRSATWAYGTLMAVVFLLGLGLPYYAAVGWQITLAMILAMVAADMVRHIAIIVNYRRHG